MEICTYLKILRQQDSGIFLLEMYVEQVGGNDVEIYVQIIYCCHCNFKQLDAINYSNMGEEAEIK